jgi:CheY-like chemotaxis protein
VTKPQASILIIDDELDVLEMMSFMLSGDGYQIALAQSGKEAFDIARRQRFDIIITDLKMPEIDGIATTAAFREMMPDADVVIASGYASDESLAACAGSGASAYIRKPFTCAELRGLLQRLVDQRRAAGRGDHLL